MRVLYNKVKQQKIKTEKIIIIIGGFGSLNTLSQGNFHLLTRIVFTVFMIGRTNYSSFKQNIPLRDEFANGKK